MLQEEIIRPALEGRPRFVLSDAFPGDLLPSPVAIRLLDWKPDELKEVKSAGYLKESAFTRVQGGGRPELRDLVPIGGVDGAICFHPHVHNMLDRFSDTTGEGGELFTLDDQFLSRGYDYLSIYVRMEEGFERDFLELLGYLAESGFGADVSIGLGEFEITSALEPVGWLEEISDQADSVIVLSTFQPGPGDPVDGVWEAFTKYGKVGPDFGLQNVFKRPIIMFKSGSCFLARMPCPVVGRAIPMDELLAADSCDCLRKHGAEIIHLAFGLAVPARLAGVFRVLD